MNPWIGLVILILLYPVLMYLANKSIDKQRKKQEDYYKMLEEKRQKEYEELQKEAEQNAEIEAKLEQIMQDYKNNN